MKFSTRRALIALGLALSFVFGVAAPAMASYTGYTTVPTDSIRFRTAEDTWVPNYVGFSAGRDTSGVTDGNAWMEFKFIYWGPGDGVANGQNNMRDIHKPQHAFEIKAKVDCTWANNHVVGYYAPGELDGYQSAGWHTNIPAAALPYEDTIFKENCQNPGDQSGLFGGSSVHEGQGKFGFGVLNPSVLVPGTMYSVRFSISKDQYTSVPLTAESRADIYVSANISFDSQDNSAIGTSDDCNFSDSDIATWNDNTTQALATRLSASWCSWQDFTYYVGHGNTGDNLPYAPENDNFTPNKFDYWSVTARSLEDGTGIMPTHWHDNSGLSAKTCNDSLHPAFDGACYVHLPGVSSGGYSQVASDAQGISGGDEFLSVGYEPSAEIAVRCRATSGVCPFTMAIRFNPTSGGEVQAQNYDVPNDGSWYICRIDHDHGATGVTGSYSTRSLEVDNYSSNAVDVDYAFQGNSAQKRTVQANDPLGNPHPDDLPNVATPPDCLKQDASA